MPIRYNLPAREQLNELLNQSDDSFTLDSLNREIRTLLNEYDKNPELSFAAQISFLKSLFDKMYVFYDEQIYKHKSLWKKFLYFIRWYNVLEAEPISLIKQMASRIKILELEHESWSFRDKVSLYSINKKVDAFLINDDIKTKLKYLSHRSLTRIGNVPASLEGNHGKIAYKDYINDLKDYLKTLDPDSECSERIMQLIPKLHYCEESEIELLHYRIKFIYLNELKRGKKMEALQERYIQDTAFKVLDKISKLKIGETALFNHGFSAKECSHATVYEVEKVNENQVVFRFINTGIGLNKVESWKTFINNFIFSSNQSPIKVTSPLLINSLINSDLITLLVRPQIVQVDTIDNGVKEMIAPLLALNKKHKLHDDKRQVRYQSMGSCSQSCIDAWLETQLNGNEIERINFYIHRLNTTLNQIESLLELDTLDSEQREYCQHMRIATYTELTLLKNQLDSLNDSLEKEKQQTIDSLMRIRKENSAYKNREPKKIDLEQYIADKLDPTRLKQKFSQEEQRIIKKASPSEPVKIKKKTVINALKNQFTFGRWSKKNKSAQTEEDRRLNKLNKVVLAKKIRYSQELIHQSAQMRRTIKLGFFTEQEQRRVDLLAEQIIQNQPVPYEYLDPERSLI